MQIKTLEESERLYMEQTELVQQLRAENAALQQETRIIASLKAEIADLKAKVKPSQAKGLITVLQTIFFEVVFSIAEIVPVQKND